ncbi:MAG: tRNA (guanosine(46)-N7)-methyltransferase TrmB, partial [Candidatus Latescibacteria bacterium]|nr:tRNA (guanosine(46)-N7)-methyltransferase TrmB [Candidatus Latescibacterota bacterium]
MEILDQIEISISDLNDRIDWAELFGNMNPVEIEIGCGKGRFIINSAMKYPDINYVGIERALRYFRFMKERSAKRNLTNIRVLQDDAGYFIERFVPDHSVTACHIYFPDPWPKKRHRKRRLFKQDFLRHIERTLISG